MRLTVRAFLDRVLTLPLSVWVLLGLFVSYLFFFIGPVFLAANAMQFVHYVPAAEHIGIDLKQTLSFSQYWLAPDSLPYVRSNNYPPMASLLFVPLLGLRFAAAFQIVTILSVTAYVVCDLVFAPALAPAKPSLLLPTVLCLAGLLSYPFQFELERGQFDLIAIVPALAAIWIFHRHPGYRWAAYALFSLSVQLKLYPLIFIVMLIEDWRDWRNNLRRIVLLCIANAMFLLAFGTGVFSNFLNATTSYVTDPYIWIGNHSVRSAVTLALHFADRHGWSWLALYSVVIQDALLALVLACLLLIMFVALRRHWTGFNPPLLLACTLGALLIPSFSHDYRLTILAAPVLILLLSEEASHFGPSPRWRVLRPLLIFILSLAYSSTLVSYAQKPFVVANNFPALIIMLLAATILALEPSTGPQDVPASSAVLG